MENCVLIIGNGGREHAICWKLQQSNKIKKIYAAPGNGGTSSMEKVLNVEIAIDKNDAVVNWCIANKIDLVVIGPEVFLANGLSDALSKNGIMCFGPSADAAKIESDKQWSKYFMDKYEIPTARWKSFVHHEDAKFFINSNRKQSPFVIKASGLAGGKGVVIASKADEACAVVDDIMISRKFGKAGSTVIIEEFLEGDEVSILGFSDGNRIVSMIPVQDHKRLLNGDTGPNTGGMGAYAPYSLPQETLDFIQINILQTAIDGLKKENITFVGVLYAGLMLTKKGIRVLEFNCRFGDPETQVLLPLLDADLYEIMLACCTGALNTKIIKWHKDECCVGTVLASGGYPESPETGHIIKGLNDFKNRRNCYIFHSGTTTKENNVITSGGRVLTVVCKDVFLHIAIAKVQNICSKITFPSCQYRSDIAFKGIPRYFLNHGKTTYQSAGVNISTANKFIDGVKRIIESTYREDVLSTIGSFGAVIDLKYSKYKHPLLVSGTDGVGTKLKIAHACNNHRTIGKDLVAMCVNDILAQGAEPLFFLDYIACGTLKPDVLNEIVEGIASACKEAGCSLVGGETAEMPDFYENNEYDLAGFAVGIVEKDDLIPSKDEIQEGDCVIYLPSNGFHSNGFSLVRKILKTAGITLDQVLPFSDGKTTFGNELLKPTHIYVNQVLPLVRSKKIKAFSHITGGGLLENIPRVLPSHLKVTLDAESWHIPEIFAWFATIGNITAEEMLKTFNCGIGAVVITNEVHSKEVANFLNSNIIGSVSKISSPNESQVIVPNYIEIFGKIMAPFVPALIEHESLLIRRKKNVAVLISGTGTNLEALLKATHNDHTGAEIVLVISNKENVKGLKIAESYNIPTKVIKHTNYPSREVYDKSLHEILIEFSVDLICLAGFMRILSGWFISRWRGKILNTHPSLLPSFKGLDAPRQALDAGVKVTGCTVHFVEEEVDAGAIIEQGVVYIEVDDTVEILTNRIKMEEHKIFPEALKLVSTGKVKLNADNKTITRIK